MKNQKKSDPDNIGTENLNRHASYPDGRPEKAVS